MASREVYARFEYVCGAGHAIGADRHPITQCPVAHCTDPTLKRVGNGSRSDNRETTNDD